MFQLQIQYNSQGDWENTVYKPLPYIQAMTLLNHLSGEWNKEHTYRLISVGMPNDTI